MSWENVVVGIIGVFAGGLIVTFGMALCALAGRSEEGEIQ